MFPNLNLNNLIDFSKFDICVQAPVENNVMNLGLANKRINIAHNKILLYSKV